MAVADAAIFPWLVNIAEAIRGLGMLFAEIRMSMIAIPGGGSMAFVNHAEMPIIDLSGNKMLPIGVDNFSEVVTQRIFVDKSALIGELLASGYKVTLFCRPRRFGKSLAMSMLRCFFEVPASTEEAASGYRELFKPLSVWKLGENVQSEQGRYPVVALSLGDVSGLDWPSCRARMAQVIAAEYERHGYLRKSPVMSEAEKERFERIARGESRPGELEGSLAWLTVVLERHHGSPAVVLVDEYDHPVAEGQTHGYRVEAISFMRDWLTGALKSNGSLRLACLTGVQRISKESIFSGLNNLVVSTPMDDEFTEGFGFTEKEAEALATYLEKSNSIDEMRLWYDGYNFGGISVYNPWSTINYLKQGQPQAFWTNTSGNDVIAHLVSAAKGRQAEDVRTLAAGEDIIEAVNLSAVYSDLENDPSAIWGQLYLAGYVTSDDVEDPTDESMPRRLRVPNREVARVFRREIALRARVLSGTSASRSWEFQQALVEGDAERLQLAAEAILLDTPSHFDLSNENAYHMLFAGVLYDVRGYEAPLSNRENGNGRPDLLLRPEVENRNTLPAVVVEFKLAAAGETLMHAAERGLAQLDSREYAHGLGAGVIVWGIAFRGKKCAAVCRRK